MHSPQPTAGSDWRDHGCLLSYPPHSRFMHSPQQDLIGKAASLKEKKMVFTPGMQSLRPSEDETSLVLLQVYHIRRLVICNWK